MKVYVGMDLHRKRSQVTIMDDAGVQQRNRNLANDPAQLVPVGMRAGAWTAGGYLGRSVDVQVEGL
jgi:hypothetical protein